MDLLWQKLMNKNISRCSVLSGGLLLDSGLSFDKHLNGKIIKAKKNLGLIKYLSRFLPVKT